MLKHSYSRGIMVGRCIRVAMLLSQKSYSIDELSAKILDCRCSHSGGSCKHRNMIRRDIEVMGESGIPVSEDTGRPRQYSVDAHFMKRFM